MWVSSNSWWSKICVLTPPYPPLSSNLPGPKVSGNGGQSQTLHISWICACPTSPIEHKRVVVCLVGSGTTKREQQFNKSQEGGSCLCQQRPWGWLSSLGLESFKGKYFSNSLPSQEVDENIDTAVVFLWSDTQQLLIFAWRLKTEEARRREMGPAKNQKSYSPNVHHEK